MLEPKPAAGAPGKPVENCPGAREAGGGGKPDAPPGGGGRPEPLLLLE